MSRVEELSRENADHHQNAKVPRTQGNRTRAAYDRASGRGGNARQRIRGGLQNRKSGVVCLPLEAAGTLGFRFSAEPQTDAQKASLDKIVIDYVRTKLFRQFARLEDKALAKATGLSERRIFDLKRAANVEYVDVDHELVKNVLLGMATETLAGVLGTPHTEQNRWLFAILNSISVRSDCERDDAAIQKWMASFRIDFRQWENYPEDFCHGEKKPKTSIDQGHRPKMVSSGPVRPTRRRAARCSIERAGSAGPAADPA